MLSYTTSSLLFCLCVVFVDGYSARCDRMRRFSAVADRHNSLKIVHDSFVPWAVAWASFEDGSLEEGWAYLNVETNPTYPDGLTAYAAGVLEAVATKSMIRDHGKNCYADFCSNYNRIACHEIIQYLQEQVDYMYEMAWSNRIHSAFWNQVYLLLQQLTGLSDSYTGTKLNHENRFRPSPNLPTLAVNWEADLFDIEPMIPIMNKKLAKRKLRRFPKITGLYTRNPNPRPGESRYVSIPPGHCSALIKYINNNIYIGHTSWFYYSSMLRLHKKYNFQFQKRDDRSSPRVPGVSIVMTSYPGALYSMDEFYLIDSGLFVMETTLSIYKDWSFKRCRSMSVPTWIRSMVANRLSDSAKKWVDTFSQENSGTYNNQYMIVDFKKFEEANRTITDDLLWVLEQMPGSFVSKDISDDLRRKSYFASFNIALFNETRTISGVDYFDKFTRFYEYESNPRKLIFDRDHHNVHSIPSMIRLMRYNDYQHDNLSTCHECDPPFQVPTFAIAARADLVQSERIPVFVFRGLGGSTDAKAIDYHSFKSQEITTVNGPPDEHVPAFSWSSYRLPIPAGHPDKYSFKPVTHSFEASLRKEPATMTKRRGKFKNVTKAPCVQDV